MDNDRIKGKINQVKGSAREKIGELTDDTEMKLKGKVEHVGGKIQEGFGKVKDEIRAEQKKGEERRERREEHDVDSDL